MSEFNQADYVAEYQRKNVKQMKVNLSKLYDKDILEHLEKQKNKQGYIKKLIRQDIERS